MPLSQGYVGEFNAAAGTSPPQGFRQGTQGDQIASELHGRFYEQNKSGRIFSGGMAVTTIASALFTVATLDATAKPIIGVWNPATSPVNLVILQATLQVVITALQNTGGGPFMWATSTGNAGLTLGSTPLCRKTLVAAGSFAKDMSGIVLTGLTNSMTVRCAAGVGGGNVFNIATLDTAAGFSTTLAPSVENVDGAWIVPPGGVLALLASVTPVAQSVGAALLWEEVPVS